MNKAKTIRLLCAPALLALAPLAASAQTSQRTLLPHATWDCGMPQGIPRPETGRLVLEIEVPLERAIDVGRTQYGMRRVAVGLDAVGTIPVRSIPVVGEPQDERAVNPA